MQLVLKNFTREVKIALMMSRLKLSAIGKAYFKCFNLPSEIYI
jgi:hypothetical protein